MLVYLLLIQGRIESVGGMKMQHVATDGLANSLYVS